METVYPSPDSRSSFTWTKSSGLADHAKKQGAAGITTAAPYIAGQWGRGDNRLPG